MKILDSNNREVTFGKESHRCICPYCNNNIITIIEYKSGFISYLISLICLLIFGLLPSIIIVPIVILLTKSLIHKCSICLNELGNDGKLFSYFGLKEKIITIKIGEIGFILTRRIILGFLLFIFLIVLVIYKVKNLPIIHTHLEAYHPINDTWSTFLENCAREKIFIDDNKYAFCSNYYIDKSVHNWTGYIIRINDLRESLYRYVHHAVGIIIKMDPCESENFPDILLTLDTEEAEIYKDLLNDIGRGQKIGFNATIKSIGADYHPKHLHSRQIWIEEGYLEISPLINLYGRYTVGSNLRKIKGNE